MQKQELIAKLDDNWKVINQVQNYIKTNYDKDIVFCNELLNKVRKLDLVQNFTDYEIFQNYIKQHSLTTSIFSHLNSYIGIKFKEEDEVLWGVLIMQNILLDGGIYGFQLVSKWYTKCFNIGDIENLVYTNGQIVKIKEQ